MSFDPRKDPADQPKRDPLREAAYQPKKDPREKSVTEVRIIATKMMRDLMRSVNALPRPMLREDWRVMSIHEKRAHLLQIRASLIPDHYVEIGGKLYVEFTPNYGRAFYYRNGLRVK